MERMSAGVFDCFGEANHRLRERDVLPDRQGIDTPIEVTERRLQRSCQIVGLT